MKLAEYGFDTSTRVTLHDFSTNTIDSVLTGEYVLSSDMIVINKMFNVSNRLIDGGYMDTYPSYKITTEDGDILIGASDQKMWINDKGWVPFKKIKLEDSLINTMGILKYITRLDIINQDTKMYQLNRIEGNNTYYVNGYLTCNLL